MTASRKKKIDKGIQGRPGQDSARAGSDSNVGVLDGDLQSRNVGKGATAEKDDSRPRDGGDRPGYKTYQ